MIRRHEPDAIWLIHQGTHAHLAGQIAARWAENGSPITPREELILAAIVHDTGWNAADQAPRLNDKGLPRSFMEMDLQEHMQIWQRSIWGAFAQNRYAGLLTSLHCSALYDMRLNEWNDSPEDREMIAAFLEAQRQWEHGVIADLRDHPRYGDAVAEERLAENLRLLQVWDYLSLLVCMGPDHEETIPNVPVEGGQRTTLRVKPAGTHTIRVEPFPLDTSLMVWIDARRLHGAPFDSDEALRRALDDAAYEPLRLVITGS
ncbi:MAG TPA: DUF3891 family protein [Aggregatilinea sp.]|uniref:DUF3891 family protein n=1 Tax=Aggregatilinea sp. TaxID=2806333 RepID=UPI002D0AB944|nr:DUF3891 family protein [Aggregatilinea sp.]HML23834.1 DUF3891 family protein [Aggregatilinea sp.]